MDKYGINFSDEIRNQDFIRLVNQLWKLIPMRENDEDWLTHWQVILEEISGLSKIYKNNPNSLILLSKLEGLDSQTCEDFMIYRKTIFKCIDLLTKVLKDE